MGRTNRGDTPRTARRLTRPTYRRNGRVATTGVAAGASDGADALVGCNLAVLWGPCSSGVEIRTLASGRRLAAFAVRTPAEAPPGRRPGGTGGATSVPVTVWDPPTWLETVASGEALVVVGTVRRRFFATRSGGRGAKAEVEAITVARATRSQLERAWQRAAGALAVMV